MPDENGEWVEGDPWTPAMHEAYRIVVAAHRKQVRKETIQAQLLGTGIALGLIGFGLLVAWLTGDLRFH